MVAALPPVPVAAGSGWHPVTITTTSGDRKFDYDGVAIGTDTLVCPLIEAASSTAIGRGFANGRFFNGAIDEVAIYQTALTGSQIAAQIAAAADVSEPASLVLLGGALLGLAAVRRTR